MFKRIISILCLSAIGLLTGCLYGSSDVTPDACTCDNSDVTPDSGDSAGVTSGEDGKTDGGDSTDGGADKSTDPSSSSDGATINIKPGVPIPVIPIHTPKH